MTKLKKPINPIERDFSDEEIYSALKKVFLTRDCVNCSNNPSGYAEKSEEYTCSKRGIRVRLEDGEKTAQKCSDYDNGYLKEGEQK